MHVDSDPEDDNDTCEEWERHEALHNDVQPNRSAGVLAHLASQLYPSEKVNCRKAEGANWKKLI